MNEGGDSVSNIHLNPVASLRSCEVELSEARDEIDRLHSVIRQAIVWFERSGFAV